MEREAHEPAAGGLGTGSGRPHRTRSWSRRRSASPARRVLTGRESDERPGNGPGTERTRRSGATAYGGPDPAGIHRPGRLPEGDPDRVLLERRARHRVHGPDLPEGGRPGGPAPGRADDRHRRVAGQSPADPRRDGDRNRRTASPTNTSGRRPREWTERRCRTSKHRSGRYTRRCRGLRSPRSGHASTTSGPAGSRPSCSNSVTTPSLQPNHRRATSPAAPGTVPGRPIQTGRYRGAKGP